MINRLIHFIGFAMLATLGAVWTACGVFVLKTTEAPIHVMPAWLWNLTFTLMMFFGLALFIYSVFRCCDEAFMKPNDTRRITGRRQYTVTRRPA